MKLKTLVLLGLLSLMPSLHAADNDDDHHGHPDVNPENKPSALSGKHIAYAGPCEIELLNHSSFNVRVNGVFDDGVGLTPFNIYSYDSPKYINLNWDGWCHSGMDLYIDTFYGDSVYAGYVARQTTLRIVDKMYAQKNKPAATLQPKV